MGKIFNRRELQHQAKQWRANNEKIVFTNGCFDLLHRGHIEYLIQAKELGDILVIGLNSDDSVKRLKGNEHPYIQQDDRAFLLSHLNVVDAVTIFDEDTPFQLIEIVHPDYLVKGGDYKVGDVVGREIVERSGGKVVIVPYVSGYSTSQLIGKIRSINAQGI